LVGLAFGYYFLVAPDLEGRPFCHKVVNLGLRMWRDDHNTNVFPNVHGIGRDSLAEIKEEMAGNMEWARDYRYVAGLRADDPGDLVLMYFDRPTRWTLHVERPPTRFKEKAWIVVPVDFKWDPRGSSRPRGPGEESERVSTEEFKRRLTETLDFVRTNARPDWQAVVAEHTKFLESIEHVRR
jgi:hypothetical protein